jgi:hypothetical protein
MARLLHGISHWWIMPIIQPVEVTPKTMEMTARMHQGDLRSLPSSVNALHGILGSARAASMGR